MTTLAKIEALVEKQLSIAKAIAQAKKDLRGEDRRAEDHVKLVLGAAVLAFFEHENCPHTIRHFILTKADQGVQKQGLGREKFEALKARFKKTEEQK